MDIGLAFCVKFLDSTAVHQLDGGNYNSNIHDHNDFRKDDSGLKEVKSIIWLDLIIVNISNEELRDLI